MSFFLNREKYKNSIFEKKNNLMKINENKTWENINQKHIKFFNEN